MGELEYKYEVAVKPREQPVKFDEPTKNALREAQLMNGSKIKIPGVSPKMLKAMKMEYVECPVMEREAHFVQCFLCPNFQSRLNGKVLCKGDLLES